MAQARHYTTLKELYRKTKQNRDDVAQLLDLEFEGRAFIDSDTIREQDRPAKRLEAYPCLREIDHVLDELRRILDNNNSNYVEELRERWLEFKSRVSFYGVHKKAMKPPMTLSAEQAINLLTVLPALFPSNVAVPKKMTSASEALIHVLLPTEDPETFLNRRPLTTPLVLVDENQEAFLCLGTEAIPLPKRVHCYTGTPDGTFQTRKGHGRAAQTCSGAVCRQPSAASLPRIQPGAAQVQPRLCQWNQQSKAHAPGGYGGSCTVALVEGGTYRGLFQALRGATSAAQLSGLLPSPSSQPVQTASPGTQLLQLVEVNAYFNQHLPVSCLGGPQQKQLMWCVVRVHCYTGDAPFCVE
ncbi:hypothetical protein N1851_027127 [Merluccius polli]|uniref:Uncharacterized protein n=1 Tax=Merluccius polli TaxID=89951 RepID=A0AA47MAI7_MERPO|nr:hypothetical protein N1851_027127 [Merluccius polli]